MWQPVACSTMVACGYPCPFPPPLFLCPSFVQGGASPLEGGGGWQISVKLSFKHTSSECQMIQDALFVSVPHFVSVKKVYFGFLLSCLQCKVVNGRCCLMPSPSFVLVDVRGGIPQKKKFPCVPCKQASRQSPFTYSLRRCAGGGSRPFNLCGATKPLSTHFFKAFDEMQGASSKHKGNGMGFRVRTRKSAKPKSDPRRTQVDGINLRLIFGWGSVPAAGLWRFPAWNPIVPFPPSWWIPAGGPLFSVKYPLRSGRAHYLHIAE